MLKKTVNYTDYNGVERTEDFYFNLTKAELIDMDMSANGNYADMLDKIVKAKDTAQIARVFKELLLKAYGEKSEDGRRFIKSSELSEAFSQTEAYSIIYTELATNDKEAANFVNGILPKDLAQAVEEQSKKN